MNRYHSIMFALALFATPGLDAALGADAPAPAANPATPADSARSARGIHYVYLIRHGIYDRDTTADDRVGNGLNALGHEQARSIGARLAQLPIRPATLVSSDFARARETADDIGVALRMAATRDTLLRECTPTSDRAELIRSHAAEEIALCDESLAAAFVKYSRPTPGADRHDVLVCHGNVIRWWVGRALGLDNKRWHRMEIANGSLTILAVHPDGTARLVLFSDVGHLTPAQQTWTGRGAGWSRSGSR